MLEIDEVMERRTTSTDVVFDRLHEEIVSLKLLPGTKLSEVEVARRFGISRQPVRDAFNRLEHFDLLLIRPQRATKVRGFSIERIAHARFVRLALELEAVRQACTLWDDTRAATLDENLDLQQQAIDRDDIESMHTLDKEFHRLICELGGVPLVAETILDCKQRVDRLCRLSLKRDHEAATLLEDHRMLAKALKDNAIDTATAVTRHHLSRLDAIIPDIQRTHADYFE